MMVILKKNGNRRFMHNEQKKTAVHQLFISRSTAVKQAVFTSFKRPRQANLILASKRRDPACARSVCKSGLIFFLFIFLFAGNRQNCIELL